MSSYHDEFSLNLPLSASLAACRAAASGPGWRLSGQSDTVLVYDEVPGQRLSFGSPVQVEITLSGPVGGPTRVSLKASNFGFGPLQSNHVKKQTQALRQQIELAVSRSAAPEDTAQPSASRAVFINGQRLSDAALQALETTYRVRVQDGRYWYDRATGAWGMEGGPTVGFIQPQLSLGGPLHADASHGDTNVFINGRQLHRQDVWGLQQLVPVVLPGRYWMDTQGNFGYEGGPMLGNVWLLAQARGGQQGGAWSRHSSVSGITVGGDGEGGLYAMGKDALGNSFDVSIG